MNVEKCYACFHVFTAERPVLYMCVEDNETVLACGGDDHLQRADDWKVVHLGHLLAADPTLRAIDGLADGEQAERSHVGGLWQHGTIAD